jgi:hypothetical protein
VKEKKALTELKTLYLQEMIKDVPALLHHFSALPALTLVGFANSSALEDVNNQREYIPRMKAHGQWEPASDEQVIQFTDIIYGWGAYSQLAMTDRLRLLYEYANEITHTSSAGTGVKALENAQDGEKVTLSMTDHIQVPRLKKQLVWYIRKEPPQHSASKRQRESQTVIATAMDKEYSGAKKRKVRKDKQQDIWCLLGQFG